MSDSPLIRPYITYEDLCRMPPDGHRYELLDGEVYMASACSTPPPDCRHQLLVGRLLLALDSSIEDASEIYHGPLDVLLDPATCLQPDLILVCEENLEIVQDVIRGTPDLIVEVVSPATAERDRMVKVQLYARHGVSEYWIVDADVQKVEILRLDREEKAYRLAASLRLGDRATTPLLPQLSVDLSSLFRS